MPNTFFIVRHNTYENCNAIFTTREKAEKYIIKATEAFNMEWEEFKWEYDIDKKEKEVFHINKVTEGRPFDGDLSELYEGKGLKDFEKTLYRQDIKAQKAKYSLCCSEILLMPPNKTHTFIGGVSYLESKTCFEEGVLFSI